MTNDQNTNIISNSRFTEIRASDVSHNRSRCPLTCPWCYLNILYLYILYLYHMSLLLSILGTFWYFNFWILYSSIEALSVLQLSRSLFSQPTQSIFSHKVHHCLHISSPYIGWAISSTSPTGGGFPLPTVTAFLLWLCPAKGCHSGNGTGSHQWVSWGGLLLGC